MHSCCAQLLRSSPCSLLAPSLLAAALLPSRSWRLGPILAGVIVASVCTAFLYRRQTRSLEASSAAAQQRLAEVASSTFTNMRTVRVFGGEALETQRFQQQVARSYDAGLGFARAKAMLEGEAPRAGASRRRAPWVALLRALAGPCASRGGTAHGHLAAACRQQPRCTSSTCSRATSSLNCLPAVGCPPPIRRHPAQLHPPQPAGAVRAGRAPCEQPAAAGGRAGHRHRLHLLPGLCHPGGRGDAHAWRSCRVFELL